MSTDATAAPSSQFNVDELPDELAHFDSRVEIEAFVDGDERVGAHKAAEARIAELEASGTTTLLDAVLDPAQTRLTSEPGPLSIPGRPLANTGSGSVMVRTHWQIDRFDHGLKGVPPITNVGVEVDSKHRQALNELAATVGIQLEEFDPDGGEQ